MLMLALWFDHDICVCASARVHHIGVSTWGLVTAGGKPGLGGLASASDGK